MLLVLCVLDVITLVVGHRRVPVPRKEPDPLFVAGIVIAGTGAALTAAIGAHMIPMGLFGVLAIAVGARRSRSWNP